MGRGEEGEGGSGQGPGPGLPRPLPPARLTRRPRGGARAWALNAFNLPRERLCTHIMLCFLTICVTLDADQAKTASKGLLHGTRRRMCITAHDPVGQHSVEVPFSIHWAHLGADSHEVS